MLKTIPAALYLFKVNNENTRAIREICLKLIIIALVSLLLALNKFQALLWCFHYYFEQVNVDFTIDGRFFFMDYS